MKKNFLTGMALVSLCISGVLFSCKNEENRSSPKDNLQKFENYKIYGKVHNELLSHANDNFMIVRSNNLSLEEGLQYLANFQKEYVDGMLMDEEAKAFLTAGLEEYKDFCIPDRLYQKSLLPTRSHPRGMLGEEIDQIYEAGMIDRFEYEGLLKLCDASVANYKGELSVSEFQVLIADLITTWEAQHYTEESRYGRTLAVALSIAESSLEWWSENIVQTRALPVWAALDIVGAVASAALSISGQYATSDEINWKGVAWQTVSGAVMGSTSAVGKVGKWLSGLFK